MPDACLYCTFLTSGHQPDCPLNPDNKGKLGPDDDTDKVNINSPRATVEITLVEIQNQITRAVNSERDRCAELASTLLGTFGVSPDVRYGVADAIRARGTPQEKIETRLMDPTMFDQTLLPVPETGPPYD